MDGMATMNNFYTNQIPLNTDCWIHIFKYLDIFDLYSVAETCLEFQEIIKLFNNHYSFEVLMKTVNQETIDKCISIIEKVGTHITTLYLQIAPKMKRFLSVRYTLPYITSYCSKLEYLQLEYYKYFNEIYDLPLERLKVLALVKCDFIKGITSKALRQTNLEQLRKMKLLEKLILFKCKFKTFCQLNQFIKIYGENLRTIEFNGIENIPDVILDMAEYLKNLESISVTLNEQHKNHSNYLLKFSKLKKIRFDFYCDEPENSLIDEIFRQSLSTWKYQIEELHFFGTNPPKNTFLTLKTYKRLKILKFSKCYFIDDSNFIDLSNECSDLDLSHLYLFDVLHISNNGIFRIVKCCKKLVFLKISWCYLITDVLIAEILMLLKCEKFRPKLEIIIAGPSRITKDFFENFNGKIDSEITLEHMPMEKMLQEAQILKFKTDP